MELYYTKIDKDWDKLAEGDSVIFELPTKELEYRIYRYSEGSCFLTGRSCENNAIFKKLDINGNSLAQSVLGYATSGLFPEVETLKDLKKIIKALDDKCVKKFGIPDSKSKKDSDFKEDKKVQPSELKAGDYIRISNDNVEFIYIFKEYKNNSIHRYISLDLDDNRLAIDSLGEWGIFSSSDKITYATSKEKKLLDDALLKKGYIWDNVNKKLVKVGSANLTTLDAELHTEKTQEEPKEELNLFPTKKHYQLNFNY